MNKVAYRCDPSKNTSCPKTNCYHRGGPCVHTTKEECLLEHISVDDIVFVDPLAEMMEMQKGFQDRVDPRYKSNDLQVRAAFLRDHFVYCDQELNEMLYEIPFFKGWKDYSKMSNEELNAAYDAAKNELIDAWHFFMNLAIGLEMPAEEFHARYMAKHKENIRRQDEGYDHTMRHI